MNPESVIPCISTLYIAEPPFIVINILPLPDASVGNDVTWHCTPSKPVKVTVVYVCSPLESLTINVYDPPNKFANVNILPSLFPQSVSDNEPSALGHSYCIPL